MQKEKLVTIIVPAYNAAQYVGRCVNSICKQSYGNIQLIIIDDGSTDDTLRICMDMKESDNRIQVYHQKNLGPSAARNCALEYVDGDFLLFVDADDYLHPDTVKILLEEMDSSNADMCGFGWCDVKDDNMTEHTYSPKEIRAQKKDIITNVLFDNYLNGGGFLWNKIWRTSVIKKDSFQKFDIELKRFEDKLWVLQNIARCENIVFLNSILYFYQILPQSLSHGQTTLQVARQFYQATYKIALFLGTRYPYMKNMAERWSQTYLSGMLFRAVKEKDVTFDDVMASKRYRIWQFPYGLKATIHWLIAKIIILLHIGVRVI